ncbi:hypothetical protein PM082_014761 [Marasmius tenuissimus]|nr:hypothetical protein PM082_014761 [Marasmius tenuissimus]
MEDSDSGLQHGVANKRQRTDTSIESVGTDTRFYQDLYHRNNTTGYYQAMEGVALRPKRPLPRRAHLSPSEYSSENLNRLCIYPPNPTVVSSRNLPAHPFHYQPHISLRSESLPPPNIAFGPTSFYPQPGCLRMP